MLRHSWRIALATMLCGVAFAQNSEQRTQEQDREDKAGLLRAQLILKIAPYISPSNAAAETSPPAKPKRYRVGVVGTDAVASAVLRELPGKKVDNATVAVTEVAPNAAADGKVAADFDLLWIASSVDEVTVACIVAAHRDKPVLLVSDRAGFIALGGGVQLFVFVKDGCVRFEINGDTLKKQGLRPSSQLLKLSRKGPCK